MPFLECIQTRCDLLTCLQPTIPPAEFQDELDRALSFMMDLAWVSKTITVEMAVECIRIVSNCKCIGEEAVRKFILSLRHVVDVEAPF